MKRTFLINYTLFLSSEQRSGTMRVRNKESELQSKIHLEVYLKRKFPDFVKLVISKCEPDVVSDLFGIFKIKR